MVKRLCVCNYHSVSHARRGENKVFIILIDIELRFHSTTTLLSPLNPMMHSDAQKPYFMHPNTFFHPDTFPRAALYKGAIANTPQITPRCRCDDQRVPVVFLCVLKY